MWMLWFLFCVYLHLRTKYDSLILPTSVKISHVLFAFEFWIKSIKYGGQTYKLEIVVKLSLHKWTFFCCGAGWKFSITLQYICVAVWLDNSNSCWHKWPFISLQLNWCINKVYNLSLLRKPRIPESIYMILFFSIKRRY